MGTIISFDVGGVELTWSKNSRGFDHGMLFQEYDRKHLKSDQVNYEWYAENNKDPAPMEIAFSKTLREVVPRLELLGFTLAGAERDYERVLVSWQEERLEWGEEDGEQPPLFTFKEFCIFAITIPLKDLDDTCNPDLEIKPHGRFADEMTNHRVPYFATYDTDGYSEKSYFGSLIGCIHPYSLMRILAENPVNLDAEVTWQYGPLVDAGWASESEFVPCARRTQTFLIATEGTSDTHILKHALKLLRPGIEDFFRFIDVSERHPFPGTGNLLKFAEGLLKIDVHNQVVFLFDNDAEGFDTYRKMSDFILSENMRAMMLPELEEFCSFPAKGPEGEYNANINKRAASIECYLDLRLNGYPPAKVIWTNYKKEIDMYQGSLEYKDSYTKDFLRQTEAGLSNGSYNVERLQALLDALVAECSSIATNISRSEKF